MVSNQARPTSGILRSRNRSRTRETSDSSSNKNRKPGVEARLGSSLRELSKHREIVMKSSNRSTLTFAHQGTAAWLARTARRIGIHRDVTFVVSLMGAAGLLAASAVPVSSAEPLFGQTNLVSDQPGVAKITDPSLVNSWGITEGPGLPFWISDNGTGLSTLYSVPGSTLPVTKVPHTVTINPAAGAASAAPTGTVFNVTSGFSIAGSKAVFLFD